MRCAGVGNSGYLFRASTTVGTVKGKNNRKEARSHIIPFSLFRSGQTHPRYDTPSTTPAHSEEMTLSRHRLRVRAPLASCLPLEICGKHSSFIYLPAWQEKSLGALEAPKFCCAFGARPDQVRCAARQTRNVERRNSSEGRRNTLEKASLLVQL